MGKVPISVADESSAVLRGDRLTTLRDLHALTQDHLAARLGVSQSFLSHVENGSRPFPQSLALHTSTEFSLPLSFFGADLGVVGLGLPTYRKKSQARVRDERRVIALHLEAARLFHAVSAGSGFTEERLPDPADHDGDPESCAEALRSSHGLGVADPVRNVVRMAERHGVGVVTDLDPGSKEITDHLGISRPSRHNRRPLIGLLGRPPGAVQRLSLCHEMGHLIFDRDLRAGIAGVRAKEELRAFRFAGALLLPEGVVRQRVGETLSLHGYLRIKADYGISVAAIAKRARDLGIISSARHRSLSIQLSSQGWRHNEPVEVACERPLLLGQALGRVYGTSPVSAAAMDLGVDPTLIQQWAGVTPSHEGVRDNVVALRRA